MVYKKSQEPMEVLKEMCGELLPQEIPIHLLRIQSGSNDAAEEDTHALETRSGSTDDSAKSTEGEEDPIGEKNFTEIPLTREDLLGTKHPRACSAGKMQR